MGVDCLDEQVSDDPGQSLFWSRNLLVSTERLSSRHRLKTFAPWAPEAAGVATGVALIGLGLAGAVAAGCAAPVSGPGISLWVSIRR